MPEWLSHLLIAVVSGGIGVWASSYVKVLNARHTNTRQDRQDEISVLYKAIEDLKNDRKADREKLNDLQSEHSACLIEQTRLQGRVELLTFHSEEQDRRIKRLEGEAAAQNTEQTP